jgi:hypothetical protein
MAAFKIVRTSAPYNERPQNVVQEELFVANDIAYRSNVHYDSSYPAQSYATCKRVDNGVILAHIHPQHEAGLTVDAYGFDATVTPEPFAAIFTEFRRLALEIVT